MSRYIDAEKLIKPMERRYEEMRLNYGECDQYNMGFAEAMVAVDNASTADVVEVVRCKDCIYNSNGSCTHSEIYDDVNYKPDYYCADGERREE